MIDFKRDIEDFDLVFLDLETTGLDVVEADAICEIGAYKVRKREVIDKFHSLVNPRKRVPKEAQDIHKICDEELKEAPFFEQVIGRLAAFLNAAIVCAYNIKFDLGFLNYEAKQRGRQEFDVPAIDILIMARQIVNLPKYNLESLARFFNINCQDNFHRALSDACVAKEVFFKLRDILKERGVCSAEDFISLYGFENAVFRGLEDKKISVIRESADKKKELKMRWVSSEMQIQETYARSVNLTQDKSIYYVWCHSAQGQSRKIKLSDVLGIELAGVK